MSLKRRQKSISDSGGLKIKKGRLRIRTVLLCLLSLICLGGIGYSGYNIVQWLIDSKATKETGEELVEAAEIVEVTDEENVEIVEQPKPEPKESMYWKYIKTNLIDVDFSELKSINKDVAGWVQVKGTNINYPFVHTSNNSYYLNHDFKKNYSVAGWVFADFRNKIDNSDKNIILYAHGRYDATMFGTLRNILKSGWLKNPENFVVRTSSAKENAVWQVFSVYKIKTTSDYIQTYFSGDDEFNTFINMLKKRSAHNFNTQVSGTDRILTLSTCYSKTERVVLHAKLIKVSPKEAEPSAE